MIDPARRPTPIQLQQNSVLLIRNPGVKLTPPVPKQSPQLWHDWLHQKHIDGGFVILAAGSAILLLLSAR